jgi:hypothetical protein
VQIVQQLVGRQEVLFVHTRFVGTVFKRLPLAALNVQPLKVP